MRIWVAARTKRGRPDVDRPRSTLRRHHEIADFRLRTRTVRNFWCECRLRMQIADCRLQISHRGGGGATLPGEAFRRSGASSSVWVDHPCRMRMQKGLSGPWTQGRLQIADRVRPAGLGEGGSLGQIADCRLQIEIGGLKSQTGLQISECRLETCLRAVSGRTHTF